MAHGLYECNACGYEIYVADGAREPAWCPFCRSRMTRAADEADPRGEEFTCEECSYSFKVPQGADPPYKCASCNHTFPSEPNKRVDHKL